MPSASPMHLASPTGKLTGTFKGNPCNLSLLTSKYSALGVHDGAVYDALWEKAQTEPLNREEVTSGYSVSLDFFMAQKLARSTHRALNLKDHIKPMLERGQRLAGSKL